MRRESFSMLVVAAVLGLSCSGGDVNGTAASEHNGCESDADCDTDRFYGCGDDEYCAPRLQNGLPCESDAQCVAGLDCITPDGLDESICTQPCEGACPVGTQCADALQVCVSVCDNLTDCTIGPLMCDSGLCQRPIEQ